MQIREAIYNFFAKPTVTKAKRRISSLVLTDSTEVVWPSTVRDYWQLSDEGYTQCGEVYACINMLARTAKGVKWNLYKKGKAGKKLQEIEGDHPLYNLMKRPNPYQSWATFIENLVGYYKVSGNNYIWRNGPSNNQPPSELWLLRPDRVTVVPSDNPAIGPIAEYKYQIQNKDPTYLKPDRNIDGVAWQVIQHMKTFHPQDDLYGLSPIRAAARTIDQINEAAKLNFNLLKNGARMSGAFIWKGTGGTDEQVEADLRRQLVSEYAGSSNAGKQLMLSGDLDWKEMGISNKDMDWIEGQKMDTRRICSIFGVAPELIGDAVNKTYGSQKEARRALYLEAVMPLLDEIQDALNNWLCPLFDDNLLMAYDQDDIEAIKDERQAVWANVLNAVNSGVISPNEGRHVLGFEAFVGQDADKLRDPNAKNMLNAGNPITPGEGPAKVVPKKSNELTGVEIQ